MLSQREKYIFERKTYSLQVFYPHEQTCSLEIPPLDSLIYLAFQHLIIKQALINFRASLAFFSHISLVYDPLS